MAIDNLNYYSSWLPAWQLTDKYSSQPWCLKSKNLDIFSSSKSVKATAWSEPTTTDADIVKQDGKLVLKTDWKVYERENGVDTLVVDPSVNFPVYKVSYNWKNGTYEDATWGTVQDMSAIYEWDELKSFVVFTDRASYNYSTVKYVLDKKIWTSNLDPTHDWERTLDYSHTWYWYKQHSANSTSTITITIDNAPYTSIPIWLFAHQNSSSDTDISIGYIRHKIYKYYYDAQLDWMTPASSFTIEDIQYTWTLTDWFYIDLPINPVYWSRNVYEIQFEYTKKPWATNFTWLWDICIDFNLPNDPSTNGDISDWDYNEYYSYLPIRERTLVNVWDYGYSESYWMKGQTFQPLYKWVSSWIDVNWEKKTIYDFVTDMWWENDPWMDVVWMIVWNEQIYMIWNLNGDWYIIPCDLTWWRGTPYIAYGCEFKGVTNIDYLMYLVWENRWISTLWVFNQQELVPILWWRQEVRYKDRIWVDEQYKFDWKILNRRKNLILSTTDNRIFQYGQTYGGKWWAFIHELTWPVTNLKTVWNDLVVDFEHPTPRQIEAWSWDLTTWIRSFYVTIYSEDGNTVLGTHEILEEYILTQSIVTIRGGTDWFTGLSLALDGNKLANDYPIQAEYGETISLYSVPDYVLVKKSTTYQDDTPIKNYNTERQAVYPIVLWNHLLEKEESDLYASYILPASSCKLEFWGMANHYHFWTFTSEDNVTLNTSENYKLKWFSGTYNLKFIEKNWNQYTFRLEWDLPVQITNEMKITMGNNVAVLTYSDFNHFRKIWVIETDKYCEWEFRFHNLNNKLELPKSYSLQIMVKGKGTVNYTPELFSVDLVANQRERW